MNLEQILKAKKILDGAAVPTEDRRIAVTDENGETHIVDAAMLSLADAVIEGSKGNG